MIRSLYHWSASIARWKTKGDLVRYPVFNRNNIAVIA